jgi:FMN-binding domain.
MKKLRLLSIFLFLLMMLLPLTACGGDKDEKGGQAGREDDPVNEERDEKKRIAGAPLQDGIYSLNETNFDENGWKVRFEMTVKDGKITKSDFNFINEAGTLKTEDDDYETRMKEKVGVGPKEFIPELNEDLVEEQDAKAVDIVTGATHSSEKFINYAQQLIQASQAGDTTPIEIHNGATLQDGEYRLAEKNLDANGWKKYLNITVQGGSITAVDYNELNADGLKKTEDEGYNSKMSAKTGVGPKEYVPRLIEGLLEHQRAESVDAVSGATSSSKLFKMYAAQLINAAEKGDTDPIEVDNIVYQKD